MISIVHHGRVPSKLAEEQTHDMVGIVDRLVFGGRLQQEVKEVEIYHRRDLPPEQRRRCWLTDGLWGMYLPNQKVARICVRNFYGTFLWALAHDLAHVHDLANGTLQLLAYDHVVWMNREFRSNRKWTPGVTVATRAFYSDFREVLKPVVHAADQYVPWEVKPSVMAEVALMELKGLDGTHRVNRVQREPA